MRYLCFAAIFAALNCVTLFSQTIEYTFCEGSVGQISETSSMCYSKYLWQVSSDKSVWTNATSDITESSCISTFHFTPPTIIGIRYYRIALGGTGGRVTSTIHKVTINPLPGKPGTPSGLSNISQGSSNTSFTSSSASNANSYEWIISPIQAGTISGSGTTGTVSWSGSFYGNATITITGKNTCGNGVPSDNLLVTVAPLIPSKASTPTGTTDLCQNSPDVTYSTAGANNASSFDWELTPSNAGTISGSGTLATASWNTGYSGTATIKVRGYGPGGYGDYSDNLTVTVKPLPLKASTPLGTVSLCQNPSNNMYSSNGATSATSYTWNLTPSNAGVISGNTPISSVNWDDSYTGTATIKVTGINSCGSGPASEDLTVTINPMPLKPAKPTGTNTLCQGTSSTSFTTIGSNFSNSFDWILMPSNAGNVNGTGTSATVNWNSSFYGTATIKVRGVNNCGYGDFSDEYNITVNPIPTKANSATGLSALCQNPDNASYVTTGSNNASTYEWLLSPSNAGLVNGVGLNSIVNWDNNYIGTATIKVRGINSCGVGDYSDNLIVNINPIPSRPQLPTGQNSICQNSINMNYVTTGSSNSNTYQWSIFPYNAGIISGTSSVSTVTWTKDFIGTATIKVSGVNSCGTGEISDGLSVTINPLPLKAEIPNGPSTLCQNPTNTNYTTPGSGYATSYEWTISPEPSGFIYGTGQTATINFDNVYTGSTMIKVRGVNTCGTGAFSDPLTVNLNSLPGKPATPSGPGSLCQGMEMVTYKTASSLASSFTWSVDPQTSCTLKTFNDSVAISWNKDFVGSAYITASSVNGCGSVPSELKSVLVNPRPGKPIKPTKIEYCKNEKITLSSSNASNDNLLWYDATGNFLQTGNNFLIPSLTESRTLKVVAKAQSGCISDSTIVPIRIQQVKADFSADYTSVVKGSKVTFSDISINANTMAWDFGDGFTSTQKSPFHFFNTPGSFDIKLVVTSAINCSDTLIRKKYLSVGAATGVESEKAAGLTIYPNPFSDRIFLDCKDYTPENVILIKIISVNGEELVTRKVEPGNLSEINVGILPRGVYLLLVSVNGITTSTKLIKQD